MFWLQAVANESSVKLYPILLLKRPFGVTLGRTRREPQRCGAPLDNITYVGGVKSVACAKVPEQERVLYDSSSSLSSSSKASHRLIIHMPWISVSEEEEPLGERKSVCLGEAALWGCVLWKGVVRDGLGGVAIFESVASS